MERTGLKSQHQMFFPNMTVTKVRLKFAAAAKSHTGWFQGLKWVPFMSLSLSIKVHVSSVCQQLFSHCPWPLSLAGATNANSDWLSANRRGMRNPTQHFSPEVSKHKEECKKKEKKRKKSQPHRRANMPRESEKETKKKKGPGEEDDLADWRRDGHWGTAFFTSLFCFSLCERILCHK